MFGMFDPTHISGVVRICNVWVDVLDIFADNYTLLWQTMHVYYSLEMKLYVPCSEVFFKIKLFIFWTL